VPFPLCWKGQIRSRTIPPQISLTAIIPYRPKTGTSPSAHLPHRRTSAISPQVYQLLSDASTSISRETSVQNLLTERNIDLETSYIWPYRTLHLSYRTQKFAPIKNTTTGKQSPTFVHTLIASFENRRKVRLRLTSLEIVRPPAFVACFLKTPTITWQHRTRNHPS
jgi:hypothetical protein